LSRENPERIRAPWYWDAAMMIATLRWGCLAAVIATAGCGSTQQTSDQSDDTAGNAKHSRQRDDAGVQRDAGSAGSRDAVVNGLGVVDPSVIAERRNDYRPVGLAQGLAPTPPMGWNSWNYFGCSVSANVVRLMADAMVENGMKDAGYRYMNIDDCWAEKERDEQGNVVPASNFPDGIAAVADYVHEQGLKLGVYSDRGTATCAGRAGSGDHELVDAETYADWGVDYVKYDNCNAEADVIAERYQTMANALAESGRDIVFSICAWQFYECGVGLGQLWRTTGDIHDTWDSMLANFMSNSARGLPAYAGPNGWNDPDMLEIGNGSMSAKEYRTHFSLWAIAAAPLIAGNNLRDVNATTLETLTNPEVIAVDQDPLGIQGVEVSSEDDLHAFAKPLDEYGARAVVLLNSGDQEAEIGVRFADIGLASRNAEVRDLWAHQDLGEFLDEYRTRVPSHGQVTLKVSGAEPEPPAGTVYLSDLRWVHASNASGPVDLDQTAGASSPDDGEPISLRGKTFAKGLGVSAASLLVYRTLGRCRRFRATVGIGDDTQGKGSVRFEVRADHERLFQSQVATGASDAEKVDVALGSASMLELRVTNALDGSSFDRAVWANARLDCE
jgi:alpha-galactosidase